MGFARVLSTYQKITSYDVFILMAKEIQTMLRGDSSEVACSLRSVLLQICSSLPYVLLQFWKTYSSIFTSPSSSESFGEEDENGTARKKQQTSASQRKATKCNVANLIGMDGQVTPRSIAYAAVLVCQHINLVVSLSLTSLFMLARL